MLPLTDNLVILFIILHVICGVLTAMQIFHIIKGRKFNIYYPVLTVNFVHQIVSALTLGICIRNNLEPNWMIYLEMMFSHATIFAIVYLNLKILEMFAFLFDFLENWMIKWAKIATVVVLGGILVLGFIQLIGGDAYMLYRVETVSNNAIALVSIIAVLHDNLQSILILNQVYYVSKRKIDKATLEKTKQALLPTAVFTVVAILLDWYVLC
jgi:hypothetical protein